MKPQLIRFGRAAAPVVIVDDVELEGRNPVEIASDLAPFPPARSAYPGLRRVIRESDEEAMSYVVSLLQMMAPFIAGAFDCDRFDLLEASFSLVTVNPDELAPEQRAPHFDSLDHDDLAIMHYLAPTRGTAFYRQRATGVEMVDEGNVRDFVNQSEQDARRLSGYINAGNAYFERVGLIEGRVNRMTAYRGCFLHSGVIDETSKISHDPLRGRLTTNAFVRLHR